ncbi:MAG: alpha/beta hydrolase-fold protein, partial [Steroidobacter sp.]
MGSIPTARSKNKYGLMMQTKRLCATLISLSIVAGCNGGGNSTSGSSSSITIAAPSVTYGSTSTSSIASTQVGTTYNLFIYLPPGYTTDTSRSYPVIYGLDGDYRFSAMAGYIDHDQIKAILIGIGRADRRSIDYGLPGADAYYNFLTLELIPFIESQFRVETNSRTVTGHSFAGLFVGLALFKDRLNATHYFKNFIAQDPTFYYQLGSLFTMEQQVFDNSGASLPVTYVLSADSCCNEPETTLLYNKLVSRNYPDLNIKKLAAYNVG